MTTYNTYQEAKIANPECDIAEITEKAILEFGEKHVFEALVKSSEWENGYVFVDNCNESPRIKDGYWKLCNPADHCMTVERFLADGNKFVDGDALLDVFGGLIVVGSDYSVLGANIKLDTDDRRYILRAAALEERVKMDNSVKYVARKQFDEILKIPPISQEPRTKVEYVKVTDSIFDLRDEFERGELHYDFGDEDWFTFNDEDSLVAGFKESNVYRRIETPMTEREAFIESVEKIGAELTENGDWSFACLAALIFDGKLVN